MKKLLLLFIVLLTACVGSKGPLGSPVTLDLYVMSQCPYGIQVENALEAVSDKLGESLVLNVNYIGEGTKDSLQSLHGDNEVKSDIAQLCARKYAPETYYDLILCQNKDPENIQSNWESCAIKNQLPTHEIKSCYKGDEGKQLLEESFRKSKDANAHASPTIMINDKPYEGRRDSSSLLRALCSAQDSQAAACKNLPKPVTFKITVVNDKECNECDASMIEARFAQIFEGAKIETVDISSREGKEMIEKMNLERVPSFIIEKNVEETEEWKSTQGLKEAFEKVDGNYKLRDELTGATRFIDPVKREAYEQELREKKQKGLDALNIKKGDNKPQVDFFVMSYCPYGNQAEELIKLVYDNFKEKVIFNPHYVVYKNYQGSSPQFCMEGYCSMHGIQELNQDVREMCVNKHFGIERWFAFAMAMNNDCTYENADSCWEQVAKNLGLDTENIAACEKDEGLALIKNESELNELLGVQGSPMIFIDGELSEGQRTAVSYQSAICSAFESKPSSCSNLPQEQSPSAVPSGSGCGG